MKYRIFAILTSWIFPQKKDRQKFRTFCKNLDFDRIHETIHNKRYPELIKKIRDKSKNRKIRIAFLSSENSKWSYNSLYKRLSNNPHFEPFVLLTVSKNLLKNPNIDYHLKLENNYNFFKKNNINAKYAFDVKKEKYIDLKLFKPDIIFYEQPWDLPKIYEIERTSKFALCCHSTYGACISNANFENENNFYRLLYIYFVDNDCIKEILENNNLKRTKVIAAGQQKRDEYSRPLNIKNSLWKTNKPHIIYAPHFSFFNDSILKFSTFDKYYNYFLKYAQNHQEFEFILKPHPKLKESILEHNLMTKPEMEKYFKNWQELPNSQVYENGNYFDIFRTSDLLITDCNSFLEEYLPADKPVIHLISEFSIGFNDFGKKIANVCYAARNEQEISRYINSLLINKDDYLKPARGNLIKSIVKNNIKSAAELEEAELLKLIKGEDICTCQKIC